MARLPTERRSDRQFTKRQLAAHLKTLSREPFQEILQMYLDCAPTEEAIQDVAQRSPDKWAQAVVMLSKLAGYTEQIDLRHTHAHFVALLECSDMELMDRLGTALDKLGVDKATLNLEALTLDVPANGEDQSPITSDKSIE